MKIGILSDTHNHLPETRRALDLLVAEGAECLVHCGDAGEDVVGLVSAVCQTHDLHAYIALGNCDYASAGDERFVANLPGIERSIQPEFEAGGHRCTVLHGHDRRRLEIAVTSGQFAYVFTGHTHRPSGKHTGATFLLNPGSCARPRWGPPTVLLLDTHTGQTNWFTVM
ncbi:MAG: YfcE family phosphodiesterase [Kiritimatiellae bacterium]|nr:YfcE family phosphodiesterase [Kiritimatiellia bacterium]MDD4341770.1 YfcE family phosphodiesterase [Kiritimatiellia bacterium]